MTNQEQYELLCEKAEKYDKMVNVLQEIREEIKKIPCAYLVNTAQGYFELGKDVAIKIIDKHIAQYTGEQA